MADAKQSPDKQEIQPTEQEWREFLAQLFKKFRLPFQPTLTGPGQIQIDFCRGARVYIPPTFGSKVRLLLTDLDNNMVCYDGILDPGDYFVSKKHYFVNYCIQITEYPSGKKILQHKFNAEGRDVLIKFPVETLGDTIAWMNAAIDFQEKHKCNLYLRIADYIKPLFEFTAKDHGIKLVSDEDMGELLPYAVYTVAVFHNDPDKDDSPTDYRTVPLHKYAYDILGLPVYEVETPPEINLNPNPENEIKEPYVVIASQASGGVKLWQNPTGWEEVVQFLKDSGYRVLDIDRHPITGKCITWNKIPANAEDFTGDVPLPTRAWQIAGADFFVGLGSGLSWLAWCVNTPAVVIGSFSEHWEEFYTPYRVSNKNVCHGCFNDVRYEFDHKDYTWCPLHKGTERHWECSRAISAKSVIETIKRIPAFQMHEKKRLAEQTNEDKKEE